jgi:hypothetical protein
VAADDFFSRWARKTETVISEHAQDYRSEEVTPLPLPTLDDVAALNASSDFSPFVAQGVDDVVKRLALKKLFSDPRFNIMDGLDTYIEDYNTFVPMTVEMVAELNHAKLLMNPLAHLEQPLMQMLDTPLPKEIDKGDEGLDEHDDVDAESAVIESDAESPAECEQQNMLDDSDLVILDDVGLNDATTVLSSSGEQLLPNPASPVLPS